MITKGQIKKYRWVPVDINDMEHAELHRLAYDNMEEEVRVPYMEDCYIIKEVVTTDITETPDKGIANVSGVYLFVVDFSGKVHIADPTDVVVDIKELHNLYRLQWR